LTGDPVQKQLHDDIESEPGGTSQTALAGEDKKAAK